MTVYLAGPMTGLSFEEMNRWRKKAENLLSQHNIQTINPVKFYNFSMGTNTFTNKECYKFDLTVVRNSNVILVKLDRNSIGTAIELYDATNNRTPVIGFETNDQTHPWMIENTDKLCKTLEDAIDYIVSYYGAVFNQIKQKENDEIF